MVKHTQTIRRQLADELSVFDHFVGLALKGLKHAKIEPLREGSSLTYNGITLFFNLHHLVNLAIKTKLRTMQTQNKQSNEQVPT